MHHGCVQIDHLQLRNSFLVRCGIPHGSHCALDAPQVWQLSSQAFVRLHRDDIASVHTVVVQVRRQLCVLQHRRYKVLNASIWHLGEVVWWQE